MNEQNDVDNLTKAKRFIENMQWKVDRNESIDHELPLLEEMHRYLSKSKKADPVIVSLLGSVLPEFKQYQENFSNKKSR